MTAWRYLDTGPASGAENMAMDEKLLAEAVQGNAVPVLRFYTWDPPAVSLGRFQDEASSVNLAACRKHGFDIIRRITGGRAVLHWRELTYSVISPIDHDLFPNDVLGTYKVLAAGLIAGFVRLGVPAEMVSRSGVFADMVKRDSKEPACFSSPSWYEILVHGRKIVGSAQRRLAGAFLQHGSILVEYDPRLEAEVIPGGGMQTAVTCIRQELGRDVGLDEVKSAFRSGFSEALGVSIR
ncbi:MAG: lipoate--protein ligase family protein [Nitrospirota bacterium]